MASKLEPLEKLLGKNLKTSDVSVASLKENDIVGIYFAADWCPYCREFTPALIDFYKRMKAEGKKFEIVFVSSDADKASWKEHYKSMPWLVLPYSKNERVSLKKKYSPDGVPRLVFLDPKDGRTITSDGTCIVRNGSECQDLPWKE